MSTVGLQLLLSASRPLVFFSAVFFLGILCAEIAARLKGVTLRDILSLTGDIIRFRVSQMTTNVTATILISGLLVLLGSNVMSFWAGYGWRDHQLMQNSYTRTIDVQEELASGSYRVLSIEHGQPTREMFIYPCPQRPVKWYPGMRLTISYEQLAGCKLIRNLDADVFEGKYTALRGMQ